jgi:membrane protease YdiL (CAAX protease family)
MKITELKNNSTLLFIFIFFLISVIGKIPIKEYLDLSSYTSDKLESIFIYSTLIGLLIIIINKLRIPHSYFQLIERINYIYYFPIIIYIFIFSSGFSDFCRMSRLTLYSWKTILYGMETFSSAMFEEVLFRGLILGVLLNKYYNSNNGILKSVIISSLIFGLIHIVNIWTQPYQTFTRGTVNQVYAAFCIGVMYSSIYLKTRNIIVLGVLHFISNFFAGIVELMGSETIVNSVSGDKTIIELIVSNVFTLIIFGLPLLIGLYILKKTNREEVRKVF